MPEPRDIAVLGAGNWGTTLAVLLAGNGHRVRLWEFRQAAALQIAADRENKEFLPGIAIPHEVAVTSDLAAAMQEVDLCVLAVPSHALRAVCGQVGPLLTEGDLLLSVIKGLEQGTLLRMSEVIRQALGRKADRLAALSGPNIAWEIARGMPSTSVVAATDPRTAEQVRDILMAPQFRVYTGTDLVGLELGGALKNVIAIASGIVQGLGLGANAQGALLTRGLAEMARLGTALGARAETFAGLSGMGDLVTTCASPHSRNRTVGERIGKGEKLADILASLAMVAEGVTTTEAACRLAARRGVELPIAGQMREVLFGGKDPRRAVADLMTREPKAEVG
jgi:glycerol-3-phosphate dehydrogenase (NAD(P)+)